MKHLKSCKIFEDSKDNSKLEEKLRKFNIENHTINNDGTIDVYGDVNLSYKQLNKIPFRFGKVSGYFDCSRNKLASLECCPKEVGGNFDCSHNKLSNLVGGPQEVDGAYFCHNNQLETLEGCAGDIGLSLYCNNNKLTSLDCSSVVNSNIHCKGNNFTDEPEFFGVCGGKINWK